MPYLRFDLGKLVLQLETSIVLADRNSLIKRWDSLILHHRQFLLLPLHHLLHVRQVPLQLVHLARDSLPLVP